MKEATRTKLGVIVTLSALLPFAYGQDRDAVEPVDYFSGEVALRTEYFQVHKDAGRFREDHWRTDGGTGGIDRLYVTGGSREPNAVQYTLEGRALYDYDYDFSFLAEKKDSHTLLIDFTGLRRYYDGSNEPWEAAVSDLSERPDGDLYVDRQTYHVELGLTPRPSNEILFGWHRLTKDGRKVLLRGSDQATGTQTISSVPVIASVRGITDTLYTEVAHTVAEKYNFRGRQEFEQYRDDQTTDVPSYDSSGVKDPSHSDVQNDDLGYTNWRTLFMFDSFLNDEQYVTANYMYNYLHSDSTRDVVGYHEHTTDSGGSSRKTNAGSFGYRADHVAGVERLSLTVGARVEDSRTRSIMSGSSKYYHFVSKTYVGPKPRIVESRLDERPINETARLTYKGLERTTLSFDVDLEQRILHLSERDRHGGVNSDPDLSRQADIDMTDQIYTFKAVRRFNRSFKSTVKVRLKDLERSTTDLLDDSAFYPGYLDSYRTTGQDLSVATDYFLPNNATARVMYQYIQERIGTSLGNTTQNLDIHRGAASLAFSPMKKLFVMGMGMLDHYTLNTPAVGVASNHAQGPRPYDFRGTSYSLLLDGTYSFNDKVSSVFGIQHTEALGTVDYAGNYMFDRVKMMLKYRQTKNQTLGIGYQFMNFNSHTGSFDDYRAHGLIATYACSF